jgi:hypothetical protein
VTHRSSSFSWHCGRGLLGAASIFTVTCRLIMILRPLLRRRAVRRRRIMIRVMISPLPVTQAGPARGPGAAALPLYHWHTGPNRRRHWHAGTVTVSRRLGNWSPLNPAASRRRRAIPASGSAAPRRAEARRPPAGGGRDPLDSLLAARLIVPRAPGSHPQ